MYLQTFGDMYEPVDQEENGEVSMILHYKTRREAEMAMNGGKVFGETTLQLTWFVKSQVSLFV
jgi:predicted nucleotidyltransferase